MTKPLAPRVPAPPSSDPVRPPLTIGPRMALAAGAAVAVLAAVFALGFKPAKLPPAEPAAAAHYNVQMANYAFAPASLTVNEGDTITWTNQDTAPHTVTTTGGPESLNSPYLSKGQSWSHTFTQPGMYMYYCTVHPDMRAEVIVRAPAPATTAPIRTHSSAPAAPAGAQAHAQTATAAAAPASSNSGAAAAPVATPSVSNSAAPAAPVQAQQAADSSNIRTLGPVLLLGGLTAAIAVFCLLLVGSRPAAASAASAAAERAGAASDLSRDERRENYDYDD
ncbi:cupredoxin family copper-binding protein [Actinocrinis sp.]|uniref:cupredoxin domain-containing protein n=1 Tax=Actinocrinis sp. TaxID=1920516 RepID=UPI002D27592B|nr:cupredoxin family copper-binding protein [Actinocrinis sp.]HZP51041.1 cupredoxin family copper-binding protein [Actinocrinis sp.]